MEYESKLTDIIASLPEVDGGFLYDTTRGIYSNQTAGTVDDSSLLQVSNKLSKIVSMLAVHFHDTGGIRVTFKDLILYGLMFEENNWLFLLHHPSLSPGMVKMTVQMALNIQVEEEPQLSPPYSETDQEPLLDVLMNNESELKEPLIAIQNELANHIGPVAELVFIDAIDEWSAFSPPSFETLPELLEILDTEIEDEDACILFRENLKSIVGAKA
jgi:hypothetical protein